MSHHSRQPEVANLEGAILVQQYVRRLRRRIKHKNKRATVSRETQRASNGKQKKGSYVLLAISD